MPLRRPLRLSPALIAAGLLLVACGGSATGGTGSVSVAVTRDFGVRPVVSAPPVDVSGSTSLLEVLDAVAESREGTSAITSIDGVAGDWRVYVNGIRIANTGTADVRPGDRVWLDLPGDGVTAEVPAVVGAFPEPFVHGTKGRRIPTRVECSDPESAACDAVAGRLADLGVVAARGGINAGVNDETIRVLVGPWRALRTRGAEPVRAIDTGPSQSGVFARFDAEGRSLQILDGRGREADRLGAGTGLVAATRIGERDPVWVVTGTDEGGVDAAARTLDEATLTTNYALAVPDDRGVAVPAR